MFDKKTSEKVNLKGHRVDLVHFGTIIVQNSV